MWSCNGNDHHILFSNPKVHGIVMWLAATRSPTTNHMSTSIWFQEIKNYYSLKTNISPANCWLEDDSFHFNISLLRRQVHLHGGTSPRHEQTARRQLAFETPLTLPKKNQSYTSKASRTNVKDPLCNIDTMGIPTPLPLKSWIFKLLIKIIHQPQENNPHPYIHVVLPVRRLCHYLQLLTPIASIPLPAMEKNTFRTNPISSMYGILA